MGRKKPLLLGAGTFVCTFSILAAIVASFPPIAGVNANLDAQRAGIAMIFLTSIVFSVSFGPISWVLASEVFPTRTRSVGTSLATCCNWAFNVLFSQVSPIAMTNVKWKFYLLFVCLNFVSFIFIATFFPETKGAFLHAFCLHIDQVAHTSPPLGKSLEEMAVVFGDQVDINTVLARQRDARDKANININDEKAEIP